MIYDIKIMGLIHYSCAPLILFHFPYTLDSLPQYLPFANGAGVHITNNYNFLRQ